MEDKVRAAERLKKCGRKCVAPFFDVGVGYADDIHNESQGLHDDVRVFSSSTSRSNFTSDCSRVFMSRSIAAPFATSSSPIMTVNEAPERSAFFIWFFRPPGE